MRNKKHIFTILLTTLFLLLSAPNTQAQENIPTPDTVTIAGNLQSKLGCSGDWQPECDATFLTYDPDTDLWTATWELPAGDYEYKVALNGSWDDNFGLLGEYYGPNIPLSIPEDMPVTFTYYHNTGLVTDSINNHTLDATPALILEPTDNPDFVTIPGTLQEQLGCPGNWQPNCEATFLILDEANDIWTNAFPLTAGDYEYKVTIDQSWDENYGGHADPGGPNVTLSLPEDQTVTFYYDHKTNWVADSVNHTIATVIGDFQEKAGCTQDHDATCLRSWLQDPDGDGIYTVNLPASPGDYTAQIALNQNPENLVGDPLPFTVGDDAAQIFFSFDTETNTLTVNTAGPPKGDIRAATAYWVARDTLAWDIDPTLATDFTLHYSLDGDLTLDSNGVSGGESLALTIDDAGLSADITAKFPYLANLTALKISADDLRQVRIALKGQLALSARDAAGKPVDAAGLQIPGVLDDVYPYDGDLGITFEDGIPNFRLWAPTARAVKLHHFADSDPDTVAHVQNLRPDPNTGTWYLTGEADWTGQYYLYEVEVYVPETNKVERNLVTDPYAVSLSMNSTRSQIVDLTDPTLAPANWQSLTKPDLNAFSDITLYELHVRDFSAIDETVPAEKRGTFAAFTELDSAGMTHLRTLANAGLTHIHLLPIFDIATIDEDKSHWQSPDPADLATYPPDSDQQQNLVNLNRDSDPFNWGYDPFHYNVPEGSYSTDPNGSQRILEFRQMVQSLNESGLRVVVDVVYNHTNASGQADKSVLDRIVPGYYHRLTDNGRVANSTCCANTATEHDMMRKLMVDSVVLWATQYKVDGFRFDLMGHHMVADMQAVRDALDSLTLEEHGVDGSKIYVYGEGWNFGEVADNARGVNATQLNVGGMNIGTFNDRIRDAVRGGNPFGGHQEQGFATGLFSYPNDAETRSPDQQKETLLHFSDQIRVALAGNLANYLFTDRDGNTVTGKDIDYNGSPAGYTHSPLEHISYISAHDNETWFDAVQMKVPTDLPMTDRVKVHNLGMSIVMLGQGIPFFHAGSDLLRSKSFDRDSYNSGDWFNAIDWSYQSNNWGKGLPIADKNQSNWELMQPLLANPDLQPTQVDIVAATRHFQMLLRIRQSSPLFRLQTEQQVLNRLFFLNTGPDQIPGVIVMGILDEAGGVNLDPNHDLILVYFNATDQAQEFSLPVPPGVVDVITLHPEQALLSDSTLRGEVGENGMVKMPARSTTVLVAPEGTVRDIMMADPEAQDTTDQQPAATPQPTPTTDNTPPPDEESNNLILPIVGGATLLALLGLGIALRRRTS